jgi:PAS domain S-box-containing protein
MPVNHPAEVLRALLDASPFGIIATDPSGKVQLWNREAQQIFQWTEEEIRGSVLPPTLRLEEHVLQQDDKGKRLPSSRKDGSALEIEVRSVPWRDENAATRGSLLIVTDASRQIALEQELIHLTERESKARTLAGAEKRFRELLEAAPDAIIEVDRDGRIVLLNRVTEEMFGYTRDELMGLSVDMLLPQALRATHIHHREGYMNHPQTRPMGGKLQLEGERKDGSRFPVEISLSPVKSDEGFRVSAIIRDISQRREAENKLRAIQEEYTRTLTIANAELEERNQEVERANRLKSEFLASMSHELRTPLHTIIGFSELLGEQLEGPLNEKQQRFVGHIHKDSMHLLELINDILDLSKIEAGRVELRADTFDAAKVVAEVLTTIRSQAAAKAIAIESSVPAPLPLLADRIRFKQIFLNLLSNAVKFTPEGGSVRVEAVLRGGMAEFSVIDNGVGIPPEEQLAVFDKFYQTGNTTKGIREGTGLGLAITQRLVEEHGGTIRLESTVGRGSRFTFTIPLQNETGDTQ